MSLKILGLGRQVEEIKEMFKELANKNEGLGSFPIFEKGEKYYLDLLDLNIPQVVKGVEEDLDRAKK